MHYLTLESEEDIDVYFHHAEHQTFIENNKEIWEKVFVLNGEM